MKKFAFATACLALLVVASAGAFADAIPPQVTLSQGTKGSVSFTNNGGVIDVSLTGTAAQCGHANCVSGNALLEPLGTNGKYSMWLTNGPMALTDMGSGNYDVSMGSSTLWLEVKLGTNGSLGDLIASINLTDLHGGNSTTPQFDGWFVATTSTMEFATTFSTGIPGSMDFTVKLPGSNQIGVLSNGATVKGFISSGELVSTVPEPGSLALMGSGMLTLAGFVRRRLSK